jgi:hypothetical protein
VASDFIAFLVIPQINTFLFWRVHHASKSPALSNLFKHYDIENDQAHWLEQLRGARRLAVQFRADRMFILQRSCLLSLRLYPSKGETDGACP